MILLAVTLIVSIQAAASNHHQCGVAAVVPKELVLHGKPSELGQWPWHGALFHRINGTNPEYACGLTVVSKFYTITAAHCTYPSPKYKKLAPSELLVYLGLSNLHNPGFSLRHFAVKSIVRHGNYKTNDVRYDVALLKVSPGIEFDNYIRPICIWTGDASEAAIVEKLGYSPGWGLNENGVLPAELQHAVMPIVSREHCRNSAVHFYSNSLFDRMAFCAGFRNGTSVGKGDSGGGLYIQKNGVWLLRGIVSHAKMIRIGVPDSTNYVVYMDVAYFLPWIKLTLDIVIDDDEFATCGKRSEAPPKADGDRRPWPWHGQVFRNGSEPTLLGDVAIINRSFVLTQASIFNNSDYRYPLRLVVMFHSSRKNIEKVLHSVQVKVIAPFKTTESPANGNNVAILELLEPLIFSENIRPICLWQGPASSQIISGATAYLGDLNVTLSQGSSCVHQNSKPLDVIDNAICVPLSKKNYVNNLHNILYLQYEGTWYARGISYGAIKSENKYYIHFLDLALYSNWIETRIATCFEMLLPLGTCDSSAGQEWNLKLRAQSIHCHGTLVTPDLVLTTATCINDMDPRYPLEIRNRKESEFINVVKRHIHPLFHEVHLTNNIAFVQLEKPFGAEPICIPRKTIPNQELLFNSWNGETELNETLTETNVTSCAKQWLSQSAFVNTEGAHICGQLPEPAIEFDCQGSLSGSPLTYQEGNQRFLRGILDFGKADHCEQGGLPEVFHDLTFYHNWILEVFKKATPNHFEEEVNPVIVFENSENKDHFFDNGKKQVVEIHRFLKLALQDPETKRQVALFVKAISDKDAKFPDLPKGFSGK